MYCANCGREIDNNASVCVGCGFNVKKQINHKDTGSVGWWWLGFFIPIAGFILAGVWSGDEPKNSKKALWGAIFGVIVPVILFILYIVFVFLIAFLFINDSSILL